MPPRFLSYEGIDDTPGGRIRQARVAKNMTIVDLAKVIKMTPENLGRIENNTYRTSLQSLRKLSEALGCAVSYLGCFESLPEDTFEQRIQKARIFRGLTKREVAKYLGVHEKTIREWEQGKRKPRGNYLEVLKKLLIN